MCFGRRKYRETAKNARTGRVNIAELATGDMILFSDNWSDSSLKRKIRNVNGRLWLSGGIVVNNPSLFGEVMLLEHSTESNDDNLLTNTLDPSKADPGTRLVSLNARLNYPNYRVCLVRKINSNVTNLYQRDSNVHTRICAAFTRNIDNVQYTDPSQMLFNALSNSGFLKEGQQLPVDFTLADCAGTTLNEIGCRSDLYSKGELYFRV
jgi:hypothetical protein